MQTNLLWTGREYYSLENCLVNTRDTGSEINSIIIGKYEGKIYKVEYRIKTNQNWETTSFEVHSQHSNQREHLIFERDRESNWLSNGKILDQFKNCVDIDIPLTPFTNSLPVNRLKLARGAEQEIQVIYLDLLQQQIMPVKQKYRRLSDREYHYENVPNDFEAKIEVDEQGFVVDYPLLFIRSAKLETRYR